MTWNTPKIAEISVGMEINCYACAELQSLVLKEGGEQRCSPPFTLDVIINNIWIKTSAHVQEYAL